MDFSVDLQFLRMVLEIASLKKLIYVSVYVSFTYFAYLYIFVCCMLQPIELFGVSTI